MWVIHPPYIAGYFLLTTTKSPPLEQSNGPPLDGFNYFSNLTQSQGLVVGKGCKTLYSSKFFKILYIFFFIIDLFKTVKPSNDIPKLHNVSSNKSKWKYVRFEFWTSATSIVTETSESILLCPSLYLTILKSKVFDRVAYATRRKLWVAYFNTYLNFKIKMQKFKTYKT